MSVGASISGAWHKHPYIILGAGGLIVLYFLWPSSSSSTASTSNGSSSTDYANQLAAQTQLSQTQIAAQLASADNTSNNATQVDLANINSANIASANSAAELAASNTAISQANAAAIVSANQTAQTVAVGQTNLSIAQTQAGSTDFQSLVAGLVAFGGQYTAMQGQAFGASDAAFGSLDALSAGQDATLAAFAPQAGSGTGKGTSGASVGELQQLLGGERIGWGPGATASVNPNTPFLSGTQLSDLFGSALTAQQSEFSTTMSEFNPTLLTNLWTQLASSEASFVPLANTTLAAPVLPTGTPALAGTTH